MSRGCFSDGLSPPAPWAASWADPGCPQPAGLCSWLWGKDLSTPQPLCLPSTCTHREMGGGRAPFLPSPLPRGHLPPPPVCCLSSTACRGPTSPSAQPQPQRVAPLLFKHPILDALVDFPASVSAVTTQFPGATDCWGSRQHHREAICVGAPIERLPGALRHAAEK